MTMFGAWIGPPADAGLSDVLAPGEQPWEGDSIFLPEPEAGAIYYVITGKIESGHLRGRAVNPLRHAALLIWPGIEALIAEFYGDTALYEAERAGRVPYHAACMGKLRAFMACAPRGLTYAVNVDEF